MVSANDRARTTGPPEKVTRLVVQTRWSPLYAEREDGEVVQRLVASEKDTDTLAREILASGVIRAVPEVSGPMPDLAPFVALRSLHIEDHITTSLPEPLGETHRSLRELSLDEWEGDAARVPASFRGKPLVELTLPMKGVLDCGLDLPELRELKIPIGVLHDWRAEIPRLVSLEELEITSDESGIHELPTELASLPRLRKLDASHLGLSSVPDLPSSLEWLALSDNQLTSLAPRFGAQDIILFADDNRLAKIEAEWIAKEMKKPLAKRAPMPVAEPVGAASSHHARFFHPTWEGIGTIALAGDLVVIGRRGGFGVAAFRLDDGSLAWDVPLDLEPHPRAVTSVGFHAGLVIVQGKRCVLFVDPKTGGVVREASIAALSHSFVAGDHLFGLGHDPVYWGSGGGMAHRLPDLEPVPGFENIGAVSPDGRLATTLGDERSGPAIRIVEVATGAVLGALEEHARHAFRSDRSLFTVDGENVAHEHALDGSLLRSFSLGEDMAALPVNRRARPAVPYVDPAGEYVVSPRSTPRRSAVDNTLAIYDAASGELLAKTAPHTPLRGNLDPHYYGDVYSPMEYPQVVRHGRELLVGALVRASDEPVVGTGLTVVSLPPQTRKNRS